MMAWIVPREPVILTSVPGALRASWRDIGRLAQK